MWNQLILASKCERESFRHENIISEWKFHFRSKTKEFYGKNMLTELVRFYKHTFCEIEMQLHLSRVVKRIGKEYMLTILKYFKNELKRETQKYWETYNWHFLKNYAKLYKFHWRKIIKCH